jgi:methyltransferase (TIGR00027 family)
MATAVARGRHRLEHLPPWVFDDPFALELVGPMAEEVRARGLAHYSPAVTQALIASIATRSRYAEDRLAAAPSAQYVILGAGLDSFAWRRPDLLETLRVFEVDHAASQAWKRERAEELGLPESESVAYVAIDFEVQTLGDVLEAAGFSWAEPAFFSWLGVAVYLSIDAIEATLRTIARCASGSEIVFSYARADEHLDPLAREFRETAAPLVAAVGEPWRTRLSRTEAEALVRRCGLDVAEHPDRDDLVARYWAGRPDGLAPYGAEGVIAARVA